MVKIEEDRNLYGFQTEVRVRLNETDAVGIVFFGSYAAYFDVGRMDYLGHLGLDQFGGAVRAASCCKSAATRVNRCDGRDKTRRPKPNGRDESSSYSPYLCRALREYPVSGSA